MISTTEISSQLRTASANLREMDRHEDLQQLLVVAAKRLEKLSDQVNSLSL